jgi:hypothetical protein
MSLTATELRRIKGIGAVLAARLLEEGCDSYAAIVALGEEGLGRIKGINPKAVPEILAQAAELAAGAEKGRPRRIDQLRESLQGLRGTVEGLTESARERFGAELSGRRGRKLTAALVRFISALDEAAGQADLKFKRGAKVLAKAEKRLAGLEESGVKGLRRGLKRSRKALERLVR